MKVILAGLLMILFSLALMGDHITTSDRRQVVIAMVDTRALRDHEYVLNIYDYDREADIVKVCGDKVNFTRRGCSIEYILENGFTLFTVHVLSNDYAALRHELDHVMYGPCHIDAAGPTPVACQNYLIKNKLEPIGTQVIKEK